jgi:hypothetical protein
MACIFCCLSVVYALRFKLKCSEISTFSEGGRGTRSLLIELNLQVLTSWPGVFGLTSCCPTLLDGELEYLGFQPQLSSNLNNVNPTLDCGNAALLDPRGRTLDCISGHVDSPLLLLAFLLPMPAPRQPTMGWRRQ